MANRQGESESQCFRLRHASHPRSPLTPLGPSFTGSIHEIDADISQSCQELSALPRYHPLRSIGASRLGFQLLKRYWMSNQKEDIDKSILCLTESLLLSPLSCISLGPMILGVFYSLVLTLFDRSRVSKEPEDVIYTAKYLRYLRDPSTPFTFQRQRATMLLVQMLAFQMKLKASDVVQTLEEMTALTQELLTSDPSSVLTTLTSACFTRAVRSLPELPPDRRLNEIIECLRLARVHKPELREVTVILAKCLFTCYRYTLNDDLEEATSILEELIASSSPGDEFLAECQILVPGLAMVRSMDSHPETSEEAIYRARAFLASSSTKDPLYPTWSYTLRRAEKDRFQNFGPIDGVQASSSSSDPLPPFPLSVQKTSSQALAELHQRICDNSTTNIGEIIELGRSILAFTYPCDSETSVLSSDLFGDILYQAFKRTKNIDYLNESIHTFRQLLERRPPMYLRIGMIGGLLKSLHDHCEISPTHHRKDVQEMVELFPQALNDGSQLLSVPNRFQVACMWALFAQPIRHPSTSTAYETALSLMQDIAPFSPTLQLKHATLTKLPAHVHQMPLRYASYQVEQGKLEQAIETLERGRALLWSHMRHLRTSIDQLLIVDPELGHKFATLNRDLEELTKSIAPSHKLGMDDVVADNVRAGDQFGSLLLRQRGLLKERNKVISQIRGLPGFDRFLTLPLFDTLRSAALSGPVIIVNHSKLRCHILILRHNSSPSLVPTPSDFYRRANDLKYRLLSSRVKDGLDSSEYNRALAYVLAELYKLVGKRVIERLRQLQVPGQSRIWWCPTSVFCSLPLHAMGPIPSDDGEKRYFMDLYICSYTPSLSALIQSRNRDSGSRSLGLPSVLLVAQTDPSLPTERRDPSRPGSRHRRHQSHLGSSNTCLSSRWLPAPPICPLCVPRDP